MLMSLPTCYPRSSLKKPAVRDMDVDDEFNEMKILNLDVHSLSSNQRVNILQDNDESAVFISVKKYL